MPYELEAQETPAEGIKRILLERIDYVHDLMVNPQPTREKAVHDARKSFKRIRAALRLVRDDSGQEWYRRENVFYRDSSRILAPVRDSAVLVETLDNFAAANHDAVSADIFNAVRAALVARQEAIAADLLDNQDVLGVVAELMVEGRTRIEQMPIASEDFSTFKLGLGRVYRRGRQGMAAALDQPDDPDLFHEWRKRVKYLWYHIDILKPIWPLMMYDLAEELHLLSDFLGDAHDLVELERVLRDEPGRFEGLDLEPLLNALDARRRDLEQGSATLGQRQYAEAWVPFVERMASYWDAWQADSPLTREALQGSLEARNAPEYGRFLTTAEAAELLETTADAVSRRIRRGELVAQKLGAEWVIRKDSLPL